MGNHRQPLRESRTPLTMETNPLVERLQKEAREKLSTRGFKESWGSQDKVMGMDAVEDFVEDLITHVYLATLTDIENSLPEEYWPTGLTKDAEEYHDEILTALHKKKELLGGV